MASITTRDLARAKEAVAALLEDLKLSDYLFDVEPAADGGPWEVRIDCETVGGWQSLALPIDADRLVESASDPRLRIEMLGEWREALAACSPRAD